MEWKIKINQLLAEYVCYFLSWILQIYLIALDSIADHLRAKTEVLCGAGDSSQVPAGWTIYSFKPLCSRTFKFLSALYFVIKAVVTNKFIDWIILQ